VNDFHGLSTFLPAQPFFQLGPTGQSSRDQEGILLVLVQDVRSALGVDDDQATSRFFGIQQFVLALEEGGFEIRHVVEG
jgi:hypothetical protein